MKPKQILFTVLMLLLGWVAMQMLIRAREAKVRRPAPAVEVVVNTTVANPGNLDTRVTAWGRVRTVADIELLSQAEGTVEAGDREFMPGARFERGAVLLKVDDRPVRLKLESARSDLLNSLTRTLPELEFDAPEDGPAMNAWLGDFDLRQTLKPLPEVSSRAERLLSQAGVIRLWNTARDLEIQLERHEIRAPFDCTVITANLRPGATARLGTNVGRLLNLETLEVEIQVAGSDLHLIRTGTVVDVRLPGTGEMLRGRVQRLGQRVDESTRTVPVYVRIADGNDRLLEGAFVEALFQGSRVDNALRIPTYTLSQENRVGLLVGGVLERRSVNVIHTEGDSVVIQGGLAAGDSLVLDLLQGVADGTRLRDAATPRPQPSSPEGARP